jgi:hypothetical protein
VWTETQNQYAWGVAGVTAGYLLDVTRRHGNRAHRCFRTLDPTTIAHRRETLSQPLKEALDGTSPFVMSAPILSDASARVFISYPHARASDRSWADPWAYEIYRTLTDAEIQCFWDQRSITPGMSWRTALNQAMADANVVIVLLGSEILDRPWCAAELEAALQNARSVGVPDIFVLKQPGAEAHLSSGLPVFEALMAREPSSTYPKISPLLDDTPKSDDKHAPSHRKSHTVTMLVNNLKTYRFNQTYAILPPSVTNIIFYLLVVPKLVFFMVGSWSTIVAWVALALSILELSTIVNIESTLTSLGLFPFVFLLCGFYAGFMGRLVAASAFDIHIPQKIHVLKVHLLMWVGYLALFSIWSLAAELLTTVWGILVGGLGWLMGNSFVFHVSSPVHDLRRSG